MNAESNYMVKAAHISESEQPDQKVSTAPPVTTPTNKMNKWTLGTKTRTNMRQNRKKIPGMVPPILANTLVHWQSPYLNPQLQRQPTKETSPNSKLIPFAASNIISNAAFHHIIDHVYYKDNQSIWTPWYFIMNSLTNMNSNYNVNIM